MPGKIVIRPSGERGHANHGWLNTHHTFSFASYYDYRYDGLGRLRVLNEDIVQPKTGFGTHPHREYEIFSYIISGELEHRDSMGNVEILKRGDLQLTVAGTGITHSEYNQNPSLPVHFLQIWVKPDNPRLTPEYHTKSFSDEQKLNSILHIVSPVDSHEENTVGIHSDFHFYASLLEPEKSVVYKANGEQDDERKIYIHNTGTGGVIKVNEETVLNEGDGAFVTEIKGSEEIVFESVGDKTAEFVIIDLS
ncbi:3894_t:CDS:2 [Paraglomus brasilianum]|uniref:3894_t:CDS:1 n=1 Tax=Paraglomus brasilianum TaxID=144538 RepID=A0A9N9FWT4_9GLOM|nr:3894_t:CDS:2 [Paraglomus brasilianum]